MSAGAVELNVERGTGRSWHASIAALLVLAGLWRLVIALLLPALSRDGVVFCGYARALGQLGVAYLRQPEAQQHPLYPLLVLAAQRGARLLGAADTPWTWQYSGQFVAGLAGVAVVALVGAITARMIRRLALPVQRETTVLVTPRLTNSRLSSTTPRSTPPSSSAGRIWTMCMHDMIVRNLVSVQESITRKPEPPVFFFCASHFLTDVALYFHRCVGG